MNRSSKLSTLSGFATDRIESIDTGVAAWIVAEARALDGAHGETTTVTHAADTAARRTRCERKRRRRNGAINKTPGLVGYGIATLMPGVNVIWARRMNRVPSFPRAQRRSGAANSDRGLRQG